MAIKKNLSARIFQAILSRVVHADWLFASILHLELRQLKCMPSSEDFLEKEGGGYRERFELLILM
jgi:hypothetical protein